jgi:hypothetical protein
LLSCVCRICSTADPWSTDAALEGAPGAYRGRWRRELRARPWTSVSGFMVQEGELQEVSPPFSVGVDLSKALTLANKSGWQCVKRSLSRSGIHQDLCVCSPSLVWMKVALSFTHIHTLTRSGNSKDLPLSRQMCGRVAALFLSLSLFTYIYDICSYMYINIYI